MATRGCVLGLILVACGAAAADKPTRTECEWVIKGVVRGIQQVGEVVSIEYKRPVVKNSFMLVHDLPSSQLTTDQKAPAVLGVYGFSSGQSLTPIPGGKLRLDVLVPKNTRSLGGTLMVAHHTPRTMRELKWSRRQIQFETKLGSAGIGYESRRLVAKGKGTIVPFYVWRDFKLDYQPGIYPVPLLKNFAQYVKAKMIASDGRSVDCTVSQKSASRIEVFCATVRAKQVKQIVLTVPDEVVEKRFEVVLPRKKLASAMLGAADRPYNTCLPKPVKYDNGTVSICDVTVVSGIGMCSLRVHVAISGELRRRAQVGRTAELHPRRAQKQQCGIWFWRAGLAVSDKIRIHPSKLADGFDFSFELIVDGKPKKIRIGPLFLPRAFKAPYSGLSPASATVDTELKAWLSRSPWALARQGEFFLKEGDVDRAMRCLHGACVLGNLGPLSEQCANKLRSLAVLEQDPCAQQVATEDLVAIHCKHLNSTLLKPKADRGPKGLPWIANWFPKKLYIPHCKTIRIDGKPEDWDGISTHEVADSSSPVMVSIVHDDDNLYLKAFWCHGSSSLLRHDRKSLCLDYCRNEKSRYRLMICNFGTDQSTLASILPTRDWSRMQSRTRPIVTKSEPDLRFCWSEADGRANMVEIAVPFARIGGPPERGRAYIRVNTRPDEFPVTAANFFGDIHYDVTSRKYSELAKNAVFSSPPTLAKKLRTPHILQSRHILGLPGDAVSIVSQPKNRYWAVDAEGNSVFFEAKANTFRALRLDKVSVDGRVTAAAAMGKNEICVGSSDGSLYSLTPDKGVIKEIASLSGQIIAVSPTEGCVLALTIDGVLHSIHKKRSQQLKLPEAGLSLLVRGKICVVGGAKGNLLIVDPKAMKVVRSVKASDKGITSLQSDPSGKLVACGSTEARISLWDTSEWEEQKLVGTPGAATQLSFVKHRLLSVDSEKTVHVWDTRTGKETAQFSLLARPAYCCSTGNSFITLYPSAVFERTDFIADDLRPYYRHPK